jgi:hypothetical protein
MYQTQHLRPVEVALLQELNALFAQVFDDPESYDASRPSEGYLRDLLAKEHVIVLAALADGAVVGGLVAYELSKLSRPGGRFTSTTLPSRRLTAAAASRPGSFGTCRKSLPTVTRG